MEAEKDPSVPSPSTREGERRGESLAILEVRGVTKRFGGLVAVNAVDLDIARGSVTSIIGPNGAGKTTLFNLIGGLYRPTDGSIRPLGQGLAGRKPHARTRPGVRGTFT